MSADNRSVATDALATLGTIIDETCGRDAIHLAVEPVIAGERLYPGQHIRLFKGKAFASGDTYGIVDPFLKGPVREGQRFWFVVYPRQITSLRHVWEHPKFAPVEEGEPAQRNTTGGKAASEAWLRNFIDNSDCPGYEEVIGKAVSNDSWSSEYLHFDGSDAHGEIPDEFWDHLEVVTGREFPREERATYFSCSC